MSRERVSIILRWAGLIVGMGVLALALSTRGNGGLQPRPPEPIYLSRASGQSAASPYLPQTLRDLAATGASGPYTTTAQGHSLDGDVRALPVVQSVAKADLPELDSGEVELARPVQLDDPVVQAPASSANPSPAVPSPLSSFDGLDQAHAAPVSPPDTNGDVGLHHYIQVVNDNVAIYSKTTGVQLATFSFDTLFANLTGTPCDGFNQGDPVALYDAQADRFILADFAFANAHASPYFECIAASKTGDPVNGGWWLYALRADDNTHQFLADYPKLGVWPDGIYMSANMFDCTGACSGSDYKGVRVWALDKTDLYSGASLDAVFFDTSSAFFTLLPSNVRGTQPPAGTPNYFVGVDSDVFALDIFKFHVNFTTPLSSTFGISPTTHGPNAKVSIASFTEPSLVPELSANNLDSLGARLMVQNQYRKIGGVESLWVTHAVNNNPTSVRWYQLNVTGGTLATTPVQQSTYQPDASFRWVPSLAVDKFGDMLIGYSVSSASMHPAIRYAGRLVTDTLNSLSQEGTLIDGAGGQTSNCGSGTCIRWGDYSGMTVDPVDDCTFWYTTEYYPTSGGNWHTRIGSVRFPSCGQTNSYHFLYLPTLLRTNAAPSDWTNIMQEGFEGAFPSAGWSVHDNGTNTNQIWGKRNCVANTGGFSGWAIGGGAVGAGLTCGAAYPDNAQSWMIYGPFSLDGATAAQFNFQLWLNTEINLDSVCRMASSNGLSFNGSCTSGSSSNVFIAKSLDLSNINGLGSSMLGLDNVWVALEFHSNGGTNFQNGAFVDDLVLRECTIASCPGLQGDQATLSANDDKLHESPVSDQRPAN